MYEEGSAKIKYHKNAFLNSKAQTLRDISIGFVNATGGSENLLDATAATGIRGIRYLLETETKKVTFIDINKSAYLEMRKNIAFNGASNRSRSLNQSIQEFASSSEENFDLIDLDPFGGAYPYLFDLLKVSKRDTRIFITSTDTAVLCGAHQNACMKLYFAKPMHNELCHETALRILAGYTATIAAQFDFGIELELSVIYNTYARIFVRLKRGAKQTADSINSLGYAYYCKSCGIRYTKQGFFPDGSKCDNCSNPLTVAGRMWLKPIQNSRFASSTYKYILDNNLSRDASNLMKKVEEELDLPLYYDIPTETKRLKIESVSPSLVLENLIKEGYQASMTHMHDSSIKTDADIRVVQKIIKCCR